MNKLNLEVVQQALQDVSDPLMGFGYQENNLIRDIEIREGKIALTLVSVIFEHPGLADLKAEISRRLQSLDGVADVEINTLVEVPQDMRLKDTGQSKIKTVIAVASGKGGVGKSTVSVNLAVTLANLGAKVGLMDADVYGPNIPTMMGVVNLPPQESREYIIPAETYGVKMISIGFMVKPDQPIVWRGPMLHSAIQQFIKDVSWGDLDYLIVDLPPGTGDAQLSLVQTISVTGGVIVTLPQAVSVEDARRGLEMFRQMDIPIVGVVENMSYLELPDGQTLDVFGSGGGKKMAQSAGVNFLGQVPLDPAVREGGDSGSPIVVAHPESKVAAEMNRIALKTAQEISLFALGSKADALNISIS
ncbi:MAG: Mrp/NBP35 family ATP-binding protein [Anaerolineales bacterium]|nr:Mrp/NBP35 family ATP-binding protein [Anaerolineales bacterium]